MPIRAGPFRPRLDRSGPSLVGFRRANFPFPLENCEKFLPEANLFGFPASILPKPTGRCRFSRRVGGEPPMGLTPVPIGGTLTVEAEVVEAVRSVVRSTDEHERRAARLPSLLGYSARIGQFIRPLPTTAALIPVPAQVNVLTPRMAPRFTMACFTHTTTVRNFDVRDFSKHVCAVVRVVVATATVSLRLRLIARILLARLIERAAAGHQAISGLYSHQAAGTFGRPSGAEMKRFGLMWRSPRPCLATLPGGF